MFFTILQNVRQIKNVQLEFWSVYATRLPRLQRDDANGTGGP